jgi:protein O-GlcNAc transferase
MIVNFDVCITSYPKRFSALVQVLNNIEGQSTYPNRIFVFMSVKDLRKVGLDSIKGVRNLQVFSSPNLGPGTKLLPRLAMGHDRPLVVLDDDLVYDHNLLRDLVAAHLEYPRQVIASRAHKVVRQETLTISGYYSWGWEWQGSEPSWDIFPTSGHGTLYPPGCFAPSVMDVSNYSRLSFHTDDMWYYFHTRRAGGESLRLPGSRPEVMIQGTQETALGLTGNQQRNDENLKLLIEAYGDPEKPRPINRTERVQLLAQRVLLLSQVRKVC